VPSIPAMYGPYRPTGIRDWLIAQGAQLTIPAPIKYCKDCAMTLPPIRPYVMWDFPDYCSDENSEDCDYRRGIRRRHEYGYKVIKYFWYE